MSDSPSLAYNRIHATDEQGTSTNAYLYRRSLLLGRATVTRGHTACSWLHLSSCTVPRRQPSPTDTSTTTSTHGASLTAAKGPHPGRSLRQLAVVRPYPLTGPQKESGKCSPSSGLICPVSFFRNVPLHGYGLTAPAPSPGNRTLGLS